MNLGLSKNHFTPTRFFLIAVFYTFFHSWSWCLKKFDKAWRPQKPVRNSSRIQESQATGKGTEQCVGRWNAAPANVKPTQNNPWQWSLQGPSFRIRQSQKRLFLCFWFKNQNLLLLLKLTRKVIFFLVIYGFLKHYLTVPTVMAYFFMYL